MESNENKHKKWATGCKPSMKRRSEGKDYAERGLYLITLSIENRLPLLGTLTGRLDSVKDDEAPRVVLSPLGERVKQCWLDIQQHYPQIETMKLCIMPDHIHGILFVHEKLDRHLGHVINGFKSGTRKAARELGVITAAMHSLQNKRQPPQHLLAHPRCFLSRTLRQCRNKSNPVLLILFMEPFGNLVIMTAFFCNVGNYNAC